MQTSDDAENSLQTLERPAKRLKFSKDTKDNPVFTPLAKPHTSAVRRIWIKHSREGNYEQLKKDLLSYKNRGITIEDLFKKEGRVLLNWAIISNSNSEPVSFICENIPKNLLQEILSQDNFSILNAFLLGETGLEKYKQVDDKKLKYRLEKLKYLLSIDPNGVIEVLNNNLSKNEIGIKVKNSIKQILSENLSKSNQRLIHEQL